MVKTEERDEEVKQAKGRVEAKKEGNLAMGERRAKVEQGEGEG